MIDIKFSKDDYDKKATADIYKMYAKDLGLWNSEKIIFQKYIKPTDNILDLGCGAGRTTFGMYGMGFKNIIGVDLSTSMIENAKLINKTKNLDINFEEANACDLQFHTDTFDVVVFSYNGLMCIPKNENRMLALKEIYRVLKKGGLFIFTAHDNNMETKHKEFWKEEKERWDKGMQNTKLWDFGDMLNENEINPSFIHISTYNETFNMLQQTNFSLIETKMKTEICETPEIEEQFFGQTRFWIVKK